MEKVIGHPTITHTREPMNWESPENSPELHNFYPEDEKEEKKNFFAIFLLFFPTLIIAGMPIMESFVISFALKLLLAFYQFIVIKNFVDKYYGD